jgi:hypothetical protein
MISKPILKTTCGSRYKVNITNEVLTTTPGLGFNIRQDKFETDFWTTEVTPSVVTYLSELSGFTYRYPGGLVANDFIWNDPHGFGVDEYRTFLTQVGGSLLYVLNLQDTPANNKLLATSLKTYTGTRYYQLGNELDRNVYEWSHTQYINTCQSHITAILETDPDAKFIAFLRQYDWTYQNGEVSEFREFINDVLTGLPMINDYSLHAYVDGALAEGESTNPIRNAIDQIEKAISKSNTIRPCNVWITEYSKRIPWDQDNQTGYQNTSNITGVISVADLLIDLVKIPEIKTCLWHALNGNSRQVFDADMNFNDLRPRPIYWMLRVLNTTGNVYRTEVCNTGFDYDKDLNFVAVGSSLWVVNRRPYPIRVKLVNEYTNVIHYFIKGDRERFTYNLSNNQRPVRDEIIIPPYSVNNYVFS